MLLVLILFCKYSQKQLWTGACGRKGTWRMRSEGLSVAESAQSGRKGENANYYTDRLMEKVVFWTTFSQQQTGSNLHNTIFLWTIPE